jgi:para-aminobenzoate synthetase/4-amino-4-deoxychorismate lyase
MIVDMIRNDLGRIAQPGSVNVTDLFSIERYRTLFQMTSTVTATSTASLRDTFAALFPCASITGAPKVRTMQIIRELETSPRGIYTGCIGLVRPGGDACFNVAIRTVHLDRNTGTATYGTGGGIVWDSDPDEEYRECAIKSLILNEPPPTLSLLETLRWDPGTGYRLLQRHLRRLTYSAAYFDIPADVFHIQATLEACAVDFTVPHRVRLLIDQQGHPTTESFSLEDTPLRETPDDALAPWRVTLARQPVQSRDRFLHHKTTRRAVYDEARIEGYDDVLLYNERGELTESTFCNLVVRFGDDWVTPPTSCGLLAGTYRAELLEGGRIGERVVHRSELPDADEVYLINSVRGWMPAAMEAAD